MGFTKIMRPSYQSALLLIAVLPFAARAQQPFDLQAAIGHGLARQEFAQITLPEDAIIVLRRTITIPAEKIVLIRTASSNDVLQPDLPGLITGSGITGGGALFRVEYGATLLLANVRLHSGDVTGLPSRTGRCGGAVDVGNLGSLVAQNVEFKYNRADRGGAICLRVGSSSLSLYAVTFGSPD